MTEHEEKKDGEELPTDGTDTAEDTQELPTSDFRDNPDIMAYIEEQVAEGIKKALQGKPPKTNTTDPTAQERATFERMTYRERLNLFNRNPQSYNKLSKGNN